MAKENKTYSWVITVVDIYDENCNSSYKLPNLTRDKVEKILTDNAKEYIDGNEDLEMEIIELYPFPDFEVAVWDNGSSVYSLEAELYENLPIFK